MRINGKMQHKLCLNYTPKKGTGQSMIKHVVERVKTAELTEKPGFPGKPGKPMRPGAPASPGSPLSPGSPESP